jgi:DNA invertase Pin-like site-specific DNA recombinase
MFCMLAVLVEMECEIIVERSRAGLQAVHKRGRFGGKSRVEGNVFLVIAGCLIQPFGGI